MSRAIRAVSTSIERDLFLCQAEDAIRDSSVTGVQTCALPISLLPSNCAQPVCVCVSVCVCVCVCVGVCVCVCVCVRVSVGVGVCGGVCAVCGGWVDVGVRVVLGVWGVCVCVCECGCVRMSVCGCVCVCVCVSER